MLIDLGENSRGVMCVAVIAWSGEELVCRVAAPENACGKPSSGERDGQCGERIRADLTREALALLIRIALDLRGALHHCIARLAQRLDHFITRTVEGFS